MSGPVERTDFEAGLRTRLESIYAGSKWVSVSEVAQGALGLADMLMSAGARDVIAVSATGDVSELDHTVEAHSIGLRPAGSHMDNMRRGNAALRDPPEDILESVDRFDPERCARTFADFTFGQGT